MATYGSLSPKSVVKVIIPDLVNPGPLQTVSGIFLQLCAEDACPLRIATFGQPKPAQRWTDRIEIILNGVLGQEGNAGVRVKVVFIL
jgi:hypothetical protein